MPKTKYLCVDTNIFIQCCLLEIEGDDLKVLTTLHNLLDKNKLYLLLPEIIKLEFYKVIKNRKEDIFNNITKHKNNISGDGSIKGKIQDDMVKLLTDYVENRKKISAKVESEIESIFTHRNTIQTGLELTPDIFIKAYKMSFNHNKPFKKDNRDERLNFIQQDCLVVETISNFMANIKNYELYFCSLNKSDFSQDPKSKKSTIHGDISAKFKNIIYFENLGSLLLNKFRSRVSKTTIDKLNDNKKILFNFFSNEPVNQIKINDINLDYGTGDKLENLAPSQPKKYE